MTSFASGIAGGRRSEAIADPRGCELLHLIRELARDEADALDAACHDRFDGAESIPADPVAIALRQVHEATIRLVDEILGDPDLARRLAAPLAQTGEGMRKIDRRPDVRR